MKKLATILITLMLTLRFPVHPLDYVPRDWIASYEFGKQWTQILFKLYSESLTTSESKRQPRTRNGCLISHPT